MQAFRRSRFLRHVMLPLTLMAWLSGCHKWSSPGMPLDQALSEREGEREGEQVRMTLSDGSLVRLKSVSLLGASLVGLTLSGNPRTVALDNVIRFEVRKTDQLKTSLVVGAVLVGLLSIPYYAIRCLKEDPAPNC